MKLEGPALFPPGREQGLKLREQLSKGCTVNLGSAEMWATPCAQESLGTTHPTTPSTSVG